MNEKKVIEETSAIFEQIKKANEILKDGGLKPKGDIDLNLLPQVIRDFIKVCKTGTNIKNALYVGPFLGMLSGFIRDKRVIPIIDKDNDGYYSTIYPNLFILVISPSGSGKTKATNDIFNFGRQFFNASEYKKLCNLKDRTEAEQKKYLELLNSCFEIAQPGSGQVLLQSQSQEKKGLVTYNEFGDLLASIVKKDDNIKPTMTNLYDSQTTLRNTITHGEEVIEKPYLSIYATTTSAWLKDKITLSDIKTGFFTRWLILYPEPNNIKPKAWPEQADVFIDEESLLHMKNAIQTIISESEPKMVKLSNDAKIIFNNYFDKLWGWLEEDFTGDIYDTMKSFIMRWAQMILKVAMILQFAKDLKGTTIDPEVMESSIHIIDLAKNSTLYVFNNEIVTTESDKNERKVLEWLCKQIMKNNNNPTMNKLVTSKILKGVREYREALKLLADKEIIESNYGQKDSKIFLKIK